MVLRSGCRSAPHPRESFVFGARAPGPLPPQKNSRAGEGRTGPRKQTVLPDRAAALLMLCGRSAPDQGGEERTESGARRGFPAGQARRATAAKPPAPVHPMSESQTPERAALTQRVPDAARALMKEDLAAAQREVKEKIPMPSFLTALQTCAAPRCTRR